MKRKITLLLCLSLFFGSNYNLSQTGGTGGITVDISKPERSNDIELQRLTVISPIYINGNAEFDRAVLSNGWQGDGTSRYPIVISSYYIKNGVNLTTIINTDYYFILENISLVNGTTGIVIENTPNALVRNISITNVTIGIRITNNIGGSFNNITIQHRNTGVIADQSSNMVFRTITVDKLSNADSINKGFSFYGSNNITIKNSYIYSHDTGIYSFQSSQMAFTSNTFISNNKGIYVYYGSFNLISHNSINDGIFNGIFISNSNNNSIYSNIVLDYSTMGIDLSNSQFNSVYSNNITGNAVGIKLLSSMFNNISSNYIVDSLEMRGIFLFNSGSNIIDNNEMVHNGLRIVSQYEDKVVQLSVSGNTINNEALLFYQNVENIVISGFHSVIFIVNSTNVEISSNAFERSNSAISVHHSSNIQILNNTYSNFSEGIVITYSNNIIIENNRLDQISITGMVFNEITNINVTENIISNSLGQAIGINHVTSSNFIRNSLYANQNGIIINLGSNYNLFTNNTISSSTFYAFSVSNAHNNLFYFNTISGSGRYGIELTSSSSGNIIKWNNFIDLVANGRHASDNADSVFAYNFWSDHISTDSDYNGVYDDSYSLYGSSSTIDLTPLSNTLPEIIVIGFITPARGGEYIDSMIIEWGIVNNFTADFSFDLLYSLQGQNNWQVIATNLVNFSLVWYFQGISDGNYTMRLVIKNGYGLIYSRDSMIFELISTADTNNPQPPVSNTDQSPVEYQLNPFSVILLFSIFYLGKKRKGKY